MREYTRVYPKTREGKTRDCKQKKIRKKHLGETMAKQVGSRLDGHRELAILFMS